MKNMFKTVALTAMLAFPGVASAGVATIDNGAFPTNLDSWNKNAGVAQQDGYAKFEASNEPSLSQVVTGLLEGATYLVSFDITKLKSNSDGDFLLNIFSGATLLSSLTINTSTLVEATKDKGVDVLTWVTKTLSFVVPTNPDADETGDISVVFTGAANFQKKDITVAIDNVELFLTKAPPKAVPGPIAGAGLPVLAAAAAWLYRRRRTPSV